MQMAEKGKPTAGRLRPRRLFDVVLVTVLGLMALLTLYPFYNVLIVSFSNVQSQTRYTPYMWFHALDTRGYETIISDPYFFSALGNTLFITVVGTAINMALSVLGAYVLSRKGLPGRKAMLVFITIPLLFSGGLIPTYLVVKSYGLVDTIWSMIFPWAVSSYYMLIMKNYFSSISPSLSEAAIIDGANELQVLLKVILPISLPFVVTFFLFYAVERWNEWWNAYLYISQKSLKPLQIYLRELLVDMNSQLTQQAQMAAGGKKIHSAAVQMATIVVTALPIISAYPFVQKYFVTGVMVGSVKE